MIDLKSKTERWAALGRQTYRRIVLGLSVFLFIATTALGGIWLISTDARREIDKLAIASADSLQWTLSQLEVEFLTYQNALLAAIDGRVEVTEVRRRFDVFYSRTQIIKNSPSFEELLESTEIGETVRRIDDLLESAIPEVDGSDARTRAALPELYARTQDLQSDIRDISLAGVRIFAGRSEIQRENVGRALLDLGGIVFALMLVLLSFVAVLMLMMHALRRQNAEIAQTQNRLQSIVSTALDGIIVVDRDGRIIDYNRAAERIFGYSREEAIGADMEALVVPDNLMESHRTGMNRFREPGNRQVVGNGLFKLEARRKDGSIFPVEISINSADSDDGEIFVSFMRDISRREANERELVEARDRAVAGENAKAELLAVMSHEIRTPLNGVLGTLQLLTDTALDDRQRHFADVMETSGQTMLEHINNVLDISRLDAGKANPSDDIFDVNLLVNAVVDSLRGQANARDNLLKVSTFGDIGKKVCGDKARLRQILFNLLGNAIKFTEAGVISVEIERHPDSDDVEFRVIDNGIGIGKDSLDRIFEDFVTLDPSYQRAAEGTGLGLGITRRVIELLGGEIGVESEPGEGSVFWFRVPLPKETEDSATTGKTQDHYLGARKYDVSVLVVEDNEINRMVVREMLLELGCRVAEADDGRKGVKLAAERRFDLILMDISMPRMDGLSATRMIRSSVGPNRTSPIVALTAHALPDETATFREAGISDVLTKPLARARLEVVLKTITKDTNPANAASSYHDDLADVLGEDGAVRLNGRAHAEITLGLSRLRQMHPHTERQEISAMAHGLAGSAALVGLHDVHAALVGIETQADELEGLSFAAMLDEVEDLLNRADAT